MPGSSYKGEKLVLPYHGVPGQVCNTGVTTDPPLPTPSLPGIVFGRNGGFPGH